VEFILTSEAAQAYKPSPVIFRRALQQLGLEPHEVLHVGDSEIDDVGGAKGAGLRVAWLNRNGRPRRHNVPAPDHEIRDLTELPSLLS
jgi:FMN hydrolase / 5-amino-6-(5-phospho-D-ribitylamino)uracil phosphatase